MKKKIERKSAAPKKTSKSSKDKAVGSNHHKKVELTEDDLRGISGGGPNPGRCCEYAQV